MRKITAIAAFLLFTPFVASASTLTVDQVGAIIGLLQAFGVSTQTILSVESDLQPTYEVTSTPSAHNITQTTVQTTMQPTEQESFEVYQIKYDSILGRVFYSGAEPLENLTIIFSKDGQDSGVTFAGLTSVVSPNDCIYIRPGDATNVVMDTAPQSGYSVERCGLFTGSVVPSQALDAGLYTATLTSNDGKVAAVSFSI